MKKSENKVTPIDLAGMHVAILDDCSHTRRIVANLLRQLHVGRVSAYAKASDALESLPLLPPRVLLCDIHMAEDDIDGIECVRRLRRASSRDLEAMGIIMLTAHGHIAIIEDALEAGANDFLIKPVSMKLLGERICRLERAVAVKTGRIDNAGERGLCG